MAAIIAEGLVRDNLDFKIHSTKVDSQGRYIHPEAYIQDSPYFILNIYAPNKCSDDMTCFIKDNRSYTILFEVSERFQG